MSLATIVGMGPGIGYAVARKFALEGYYVGMMSRSEERLVEYTQEFYLMGVKARGEVCDAGDESGVREAFARLHAELGSTDVLVYNAAVLKKARPDELSVERLVCEFRVNVAGALACVQNVIPNMIERGQGTILFTGGGFAGNPHPAFTSLGVGKAALKNLGFVLAKEYEPHGVHVEVMTIDGKVEPNTVLDPERIALEYWRAHIQPRESWEREIVLSGETKYRKE